MNPQEAVSGFVADMKAQGIHVGLGAPGSARCVCCDEPWPCAASKEKP